VPSSKDIFIVNDDNMLADQKTFHTTVARLLYLAKRVRPDLLLPISYLCTRVNSPSEDDNRKLTKVLEYLNTTKERGLKIICGNEVPTVECFVDASFSTHDDGKGHTGCVVMVNGCMVYASSRKQKICTKDSTEAELVGVSDNVVKIESITELVKKMFGTMLKPTLYQDNQSCIKLICGGIAKQRTRHITARLACVKEAAKEWDVKYRDTDKMLADVLTKPKPPKLFHSMTSKIMNGINRAEKELMLANVEKLKEKKKSYV